MQSIHENLCASASPGGFIDDLWFEHIARNIRLQAKNARHFARQKPLKRKNERLLNILIDEKCVWHTQRAVF